MLNDDYEPRDGEEEILEVLRETGRNRPKNIYDAVEADRGTAQHQLDRLLAAGWIERPEPGIYEFVADPREMSDHKLAMEYIRHGRDLDAYALNSF